jgi:hypothetical protein
VPLEFSNATDRHVDIGGGGLDGGSEGACARRRPLLGGAGLPMIAMPNNQIW